MLGYSLAMAFPNELRAAFPSAGPDWDRAVEMGIDVSLLVENLKLTPTQRLERLESLLNELEELKQNVKPVEHARGPVP
ncbi:MAG: hypothetical protein QM723_21210 [Myxococcaceae bacterium]